MVHNGHSFVCSRLKVKNGAFRVLVRNKTVPQQKVVSLKPKLNSTKMFDWDPIIDGAALAGEAIAPELFPFIHLGKTALKHWLKKEHKEKKEKHHKGSHMSEAKAAFSGSEDERRLEPFKNILARRVVPSGPSASVRTFDNQFVTRAHAEAYATTRNNFAGRISYGKNVAIQDNLRQCMKQSRLVKVPGIENYAPMKKESHISEHSVPVLNGNMGTSMDMHPVTISKSESHAIMAGSELLTDLSIVAGGGTPGNNIMDYYINPMTWEGTKLQIEAKTWQQYRFRKFVIEYCPTIGSGTTGNFIAWFTQDPDEQMANGLQQRRNAMVHPHAVNFQPFSYMCCALTEKPQDNTLYYIDADAGVEDRLSYQGRVLITNNAQNGDVSTIPAYGTITIHYEVDFYFPRIDSSGTTSGPTAASFTGDATPATNAVVLFSTPTTNLPGVSQGSIYTFAFNNLPANFGNCMFKIPGVASIYLPVVDGQTYLMRVRDISGANANVYVFNSMRFANGDNFSTDGAVWYIQAPLPAANATWGFANIQKVNPFLLDVLKNDERIIEVKHDDPESSSDEHDCTPDCIPDIEDLTISETALVNLKRQAKTMSATPLPQSQLPSISRSTHALTPITTRK